MKTLVKIAFVTFSGYLESGSWNSRENIGSAVDIGNNRISGSMPSNPNATFILQLAADNN